jgi:hypothetical protein
MAPSLQESAMKTTGSVTHLINQLGAGDPAVWNQAAQEIWQRYSQRLLQLAKRKLDQRIRQREDEDDVLQSMYKSFFLRQQRGAFDLGNRDDLWQVLVMITVRKVRNVTKKQGRNRRDYRREQGELAPPTDASLGPQGVCAQIAGADPTPEEAAALSEELQRRLRILSPALRQIALWKLEGHTTEEIAGEQVLNCAPRTVRRKLELIRSKWETLADSDPSPDTRR